MLNQLTLGVGLKDDATFENFYAGKNLNLVTELKKMASGEGERFVYLYNPSGQGSTHLLQACCHHAHQAKLSSVYLPLQQLLDYTPDILTGLESLSLVCIDDLPVFSNHPDWQEALFHTYNRIQEQGGRLLIAASVLPKALHCTLPDLVSRLSACMIYTLQALNDEEKLIALTMRARLRGMYLSEEVGRFLLTHCPRQMTMLFTALDAIDKASLAAQRKLTIPFVKTVLEI